MVDRGDKSAFLDPKASVGALIEGGSGAVAGCLAKGGESAAQGWFQVPTIYFSPDRHVSTVFSD